MPWMEPEHHQAVRSVTRCWEHRRGRRCVTNIVHAHTNGRITVGDALQQFRALLREYRESDRVSFETMYACVNDCPLPVLADEPLVITGRAEYPQQQAVFKNRKAAVEERDRIREQSGNRAINVYQLTVEPDGEGETGE